MRIGILGGTFDPIHNGHIYLAEEALKKLSLEKIIFIPASMPPHKNGEKVTKIEYRYKMAELAISGNKNFELSDIEIKRPGRSYSVQTLQQLREKYGQAAEIFFITGSDSVSEIDKWKKIDEILTLCKFVIVERPKFAAQRLNRNFISLDIDAKDISSTGIREKVRQGQPIDTLVPEKVGHYIKVNHLYEESKRIK